MLTQKHATSHVDVNLVSQTNHQGLHGGNPWCFPPPFSLNIRTVWLPWLLVDTYWLWNRTRWTQIGPFLLRTVCPLTLLRMARSSLRWSYSSAPARVRHLQHKGEMRQWSKCNSTSHTDGAPAAAEAGFCNPKTFRQASVHTHQNSVQLCLAYCSPRQLAVCDDRPAGCLQ